MRRPRATYATRWLAATVALVVLAACGRRTARPAAPDATRPAATTTATAPGEVGPAAFDTTLIPRQSPDSTGQLGAPGYGFRRGGRY